MFELQDLPSMATIRSFGKRFPDLNPTALEAWIQLLHTAGLVEQRFEAYIGEYELSQRAFFVLILLGRNPAGLSLSELADGTGVSNATMSGVADRLEKRGLLERVVAEDDRRSQRVTLSKSGGDLLKRLLPGHYRTINTALRGLSLTEKRTLIGLLNKIKTKMD